MTTDHKAPAAPVTTFDFLDALKAARLAEKLTERQRYALENPPTSFRVDETDAAADGYFSGRGRIDVREYAGFLLANHRTRRAHTEAAIEALRNKSALSVERIERLGREIANLRAVPDELALALEMPADPPRARAADRFEALLKIYATNAARNQRARIV
jgi:hypothetical protein